MGGIGERSGSSTSVVVAEGFVIEGEQTAHSTKGNDAFGRPRLGGVGERVAAFIERDTGIETRATLLGHIQRGGVPTAFDRVLATRFGMRAVDLASEGRWGRMVALRGTEVEDVDFDAALGESKRVTDDRYQEAARLFG